MSWARFKRNGDSLHRTGHVSEVNITSPVYVWDGELMTFCFVDLFFFNLDTMWSIVQVTESGTLALTQQLSQLQTNNGEVPMKPALGVRWTIIFPLIISILQLLSMK